MKAYKSNIKLSELDFDLDSINYSNKMLTNEQILNRRWKNVDLILRKALPKIKKQYIALGDDILAVLKDIDFEYDKLNQTVSRRVRRIVENKIEFWTDSGLMTGYLQYMTSTHTWSYSSCLKLLIIGLYAERYMNIKNISNDVFIVSAIDSYTQSNADRDRQFFDELTLATILGFAIMPVIGNTYEEYLDSLMMSQTDEMFSDILTAMIIGVALTEEQMDSITEKQSHRVLNINKDKYSGGLDDAARTVSNKAYMYDTEEDELQARFIAEMDNRTTKMCKSLDNQLFYVNKMNHFIRWSATANGYVNCECLGLVEGLNLPPINDHFHWCRSTITYQTELSREEIDKMMNR